MRGGGLGDGGGGADGGGEGGGEWDCDAARRMSSRLSDVDEETDGVRARG